MLPLEKIFAQARAHKRHIVLPEGDDPRIREAARLAHDEGLAQITLLSAKPEETRAALGTDGVAVIDPATAPSRSDYAHAYHALRAHKGITPEAADQAVTNPLTYAAMMVRQGDADGTIAGAVATTADTVREALQVIGRAPGVQLVSSFFLMLACEKHHNVKGGMIFADCGLIIDPDSRELAAIAAAAAESCVTLLDTQPRIAMLSFSTAGSANHGRVDKVREAREILHDILPDLEADGEFQFDAAFEDAIRKAKAPNSRLSGRPNIFVFPNLDAGNIGYKIAQRLGGLTAIGPILQGLAHPANDLSRGCNVEDIRAMIAVTAVQASSASGR